MGPRNGFAVLRLVFPWVGLTLLFLSQRYWFLSVWRLVGRFRRPATRSLLRSICVAALVLVVLAVFAGVAALRWRFLPLGWAPAALAGLWLSSSLLAYLAIQLVRTGEWLWLRVRPRRRRAVESAEPDTPADPSRRYFFQTAGFLAGAVPFVGAVYGFAAERLNFQVRRVEVPLEMLPVALDGLRITQLSDIHISSYMPREQVRRAVDMANALGGDLAIVTGDFITGSNDPLEDCIAELAQLRAPLGIWGCNGNHEIYARAEARAAALFRQHGMHLLRQQSAELVWRGQPFNLIGVDYQRTRDRGGRTLPMLAHVEPLVRRDVFNILLSHNPNAFPRAAEMGIELTLGGHTHGGQVQVEILDHRLNPARFMTPYIAGLYRRPLFASAQLAEQGVDPPPTGDGPLATACIYVNRGLGTIGAPVRFGVPPEITLLTLRRV